MKRKKLKTSKGTIVYWTNEKKENAPELVFLPGLTADHRLFIKQIQHFQNDCSVFVWDAPGHAFSYPFEMDFTLEDKARYAKLAGHGFYIVAQAIKAELPYEITCPSLLICGTKDQAGFTKRYDKEWAKQSGIPIEWIEGAGHNPNTDEPEKVNSIIENFIR